MENNIDSYSEDGKILLKCPNVARYRIKEGCERVDEKAFVGCPQLKKLYVPYTFTEEAAIRTFELLPTSVDNFVAWNRPYVDEVYDVNEFWYDEIETRMDEYGVVYANEGRRLIMATRPELIGEDYCVPDGVLTICDGAFGFCNEYLVLSVPWSIEVIGDYIFGQEGGKIVIRK